MLKLIGQQNFKLIGSRFMATIDRPIGGSPGTAKVQTHSKKQYLLAENLYTRNLLRLHGKDTLAMLQGLVTNDVTRLRKKDQSIYALLLNKNGKVLGDTIIYRTADCDTFLMEHDRNILPELKRHTRQFKARDWDVDIESLNGDFTVWSVFQNDNSGMFKDPLTFAYDKNGGSIGLKFTSDNLMLRTEDLREEILLCRDPRLKQLGARIVVPQNFTMRDLNRLFPNCLLESPGSKNDYKRLRYRLGIGEGTEDHIPGKLLALETNVDFLNGLCLKKSNYIGHENSLQPYQQNIRKRIVPLIINGRLDFSNMNVHLPNGRHVGKLLGRKGRNGLALLRIDQAFEALRLMVDGVPCELKRPTWWPGTVKVAKKAAMQENFSQFRNEVQFAN